MSNAKKEKAAWCNCKKINLLNGIMKWPTGHHIDKVSDDDTDAAGFFFKTQTRAHDTSTCVHCGYLAVWSVTNPYYEVPSAEPKPEDNEHALLWQKAE